MKRTRSLDPSSAFSRITYLSIYPDDVQDIYGHGSAFLKDEIYESFGDGLGFPNLVGVRDRADHARKRKCIAHGFSRRNLVDHEYVVQSCIELLVKRLDEYLQGPPQYHSLQSPLQHMAFQRLYNRQSPLPSHQQYQLYQKQPFECFRLDRV